jgi:hypothetical protein
MDPTFAPGLLRVSAASMFVIAGHPDCWTRAVGLVFARSRSAPRVGLFVESHRAESTVKMPPWCVESGWRWHVLALTCTNVVSWNGMAPYERRKPSGLCYSLPCPELEHTSVTEDIPARKCSPSNGCSIAVCMANVSQAGVLWADPCVWNTRHCT